MKPQDFLSKAENSSEVTFLNEYKSESIVWDYYYNFTGWLNGKYFCIYFSSVSNKERIEISELTENQNEFKKFFGL